MQNSTSTNPTVAKLLEADAELAATEVELNAQIQSIQQKRYSLKTVIDMFAPVNTAANLAVATPTPTPTPALIPVAEEQLQPTTPENTVVPDLNGANADSTEAEASVAPQPQKQKALKNSSSTTSKQSKKSAPTKKSSQQADIWQQYVKDEFKDAPLSEAVAQVVQQQSGEVLETATIIDVIFVGNIPKEIRSIARERVSNVLSVGAKGGKWYRGKLGKYSMSKAAVEG